MQLDENDRPLRCTLWGAKLLSVLQIIVLGVPAVVLTLLSIVLCPCCVFGTGTTNRERGEYQKSEVFALTACFLNHTHLLHTPQIISDQHGILLG